MSLSDQRPTAPGLLCIADLKAEARGDSGGRLVRASGMSGCRDLLFNVMEQRFTIPDIKACLSDHGFSFPGFDLDPDVMEKFKRQSPDPQTFWNMDLFSLRKNRS